MSLNNSIPWVPSGFLVMLVLYVAGSCANITQPTGGPKDTIPPVLIRTIPDNQSLNYKEDFIELEFSEYLKLSNLKNELVITPRIPRENYDYKIRKNRVILDFLEPLDDSTTYTFNFNESIADITEGNIAQNVIFSFSTGNYIDSVTLSGSVFDLMSNEPLEGAVVALFEIDDTLNFLNSEPIYFTKTDKQGFYKFQNLKNTAFRISSFLDENSNLIADVKSESHAFISDSVGSFTDTVKTMRSRIFDISELELQRSTQSGTYFHLRFNKPIVDYELQCSHDFQSHPVDENSTIRIYNNLGYEDSVLVSVTARDSSQQVIQDTLYVGFRESKVSADDFTTKLDKPGNKTADMHVSYSIEFNKPVADVYFDSLYFHVDTIRQFPLTETNLSWNKYKTHVKISYVFNFDSLNSIFAEYDSILSLSRDSLQEQLESNPENARRLILDLPQKSKRAVQFYSGIGSFISIEEDSSTMMSHSLTIIGKEDVGLIRGEIDTKTQNFEVQLYQESRIIKTVSDLKLYNFKNLLPDNYELRVLIDDNGDGIWHPGNYLENIEPESIYFYPQEIPVKPNWEIENNVIKF
jgi:hypothetical protein